MTNQPFKQKSENLFTFKSFNQQLSEISIKLINKKDTFAFQNDDENDDDKYNLSCFYLTLEKFNNLNGTLDYFELKKSLGHLVSVKTLPQILIQKDKIFNALINNLKKENNQALEVIIELLSSLAKDIHIDFYDYFEETFLSLIKFLDAQNVSIIESIFHCFAYLFKILWKPMVKDIKKIFHLFSKHLFNFDQKDYNRTFAAQSFAFLIRKTSNCDQFINFILKEVSNNKGISFGISCLLFETVKGVKTQFHSCFFSFINSLLRQYIENWKDQDLVKECVHEAFHLIFCHTDKLNSKVIWSCLFEAAKNNCNSSSNLKLILEIIFKMVEYKKCHLVVEGNLLLNFINNFIQEAVCDKDCLIILIEISSLVLINLNKDLSFESVEALLNSTFHTTFNYKISFQFAQNLFSYIFFEKYVLPRLLVLCHKYLTSEPSPSFFDSLLILYQLIKFKRPLTLPHENFSTTVYPLNFCQSLQITEITIIEVFLSVLKNHNDWESIIKVVKILPHVKPLDTETCGLALVDLFYNIRSLINQDFDSKKIAFLETILLEIVHSLIFLNFSPIFDQIKLSLFIDLLKVSPSNQMILHSIVSYLQYARKIDRKDIFNLHLFEEVYFNYLQKNLQHFNSTIRLLTLLLVILFDPPLPPTEDGSVVKSIFSICLEAEMIPTTLHDFREKLRLMSLLDYEMISYAIPIATLSDYSYQYSTIYFLLGSLYNNFSLLWIPIQKLIESHVRGLKNFTKSWDIICQHYNTTQELIYDEVIDGSSAIEIKSTNFINLNYDHLNHRILILDTFKLIVDVIEPRNADIVRWFFVFVDKETSFINLTRFKQTENIFLNEQSSVKNDQIIEKNDIEIGNDEDEEDKNVNESDKNDRKNKNNSKLIEKKKAIWKTMIAFLKLFSSFRNPKAIYKEKQLRDLYNLLLTMKNSYMQKLALNCILTYNYDFLAPYCDNLLRLIDDNTFKSEIVSFNLSSNHQEESQVDSNFRPKMIPYLMRILYGKMLSKTGSKTAGRSYSRRSIIFRFLANFSESELVIFVQLAFSNFYEYLKMDYQKIEQVFNEMDLKEIIPLKYVKNCLNNLEIMMNHLGNIVQSLLPTIFKLLLVASFYVTILLSKRFSIKKVFVSRLKTLRTECVKLINLFFITFNQYSFSPEEIDVLFKALINPLLVNLDHSSLETPSPTLKLFLTLSEHARYFVLFVKKTQVIGHLERSYPLLCIINLYSNDKADNSVVTCISQILSNLLSLHNYQLMGIDSNKYSGQFLEINDLINDEYRDYYLSENDELNFGTIILKPFLSEVLSRLQKNFQKRITNRRSKSKGSIITEEESIILSHISASIEKEADCMILVNLLIDSIDLNNNNLSEESAFQTLKSVKNLINRCKSNPRQYIFKLSRLLNCLIDRSARLEIIEILKAISLNDSSCYDISNLIELINSYNPRYPEEPNFSVRDQGFVLCKKKIEAMAFKGEFDTELIYLIVHNCCFFIRNIDDLGLREESSDLIKLIIEKLCESKKDTLFNRICFDILYSNEIIKGLKHLNENVKHEFIGILAELIKYGKEKHSFFAQLSSLCNEEEPDLDFWLNIRHIQVHRRVRALNRLARSYSILNQISPQILNHCLLSIALSFLFDKKYGKYPTAVTAGIDLIGSICLFLNWQMYESLLKQHLKLLSEDRDNHKTIVRVISAILENFNFDLSNSQAAEKDAICQNLNNLESLPIKRQVFDSEMSTKIHLSIVENLLPKLFESLHRLAYADHDHDSIRLEYQEEDEIKRIPISIAIVKLLLHIPILPSVLDTNIQAVFLRLCHFLKSRTESIREVARSTLTKIMQYLNPKHLRTLIFELRSCLRKGYQLHVLTYSIHVILENMASNFEKGDLDDCVEILIEICNQELFSNIAEEKEIGKIVVKLKEAKKLKSYEIYRLIGKFISDKMLIIPMVPLKNNITEAFEPKALKKSSTCLQKYFNGLTENKGLSVDCLLNFILNVVEDKIPELSVKKVKKLNKSKSLIKDYRLLEPEPKIKIKPKTSPKANVFILFEYCFKLLLSLFKKDKVRIDSENNKSLLTKFIPLFINSLNAKHPKLTTTALRLINYIIIKFKDLHTFKDQCNIIKDNILVLLHEYTGHGYANGDNFELISACFKTISSLIREINELKVDEEQLRVLLLYVDQDINDRYKQSNAFILLKSILSKKLFSPELPEIMKKIAIIVIQSDEEFIRNEGRHVWLKYLLEYIHDKEFENYVMFFLRQLNYELNSGREWTLKFIESLLNHLGNEHLESMGSIIFIHISARLINDDSSKCRNLSSSILKQLITRSSLTLKNLYFKDIVIPWFQESSSIQRHLAAQICQIFIEAESSHFKFRFQFYFPLLEQQLNPDRYPKRDYNSEPTSEDFLINQLLKLFHKSLEIQSSLVHDKKWSKYINPIWFYIENFYLSYSNLWIRVLCLKIIGFLFSQYSTTSIVEALINSKESEEYFLHQTPNRIWSLCKQHLVMFNSLYEAENISDILVKNLLSIGRILNHLPDNFVLKSTNTEINLKLQNRLKIEWFFRRLIREINRETVKYPNRFEVRIAVFKWITVMVVEMDVEKIKSNLHLILVPLCREVAKKNVADMVNIEENNPKRKLMTLSFQLFELIRDKVESELFTKTYARVVSFLNRKKSERKALKAIEFVTDPMKAVLRKQKKHILSRLNRKRRMLEKKGKQIKKQRIS